MEDNEARVSSIETNLIPKELPKKKKAERSHRGATRVSRRRGAYPSCISSSVRFRGTHALEYPRARE